MDGQTMNPNDLTSPPAPSATVPDWTRERVQPGRLCAGPRLVRAIRGYQYWRPRFGIIGRIFSIQAKLRHGFWSVVAGADIPITCRLGGGLVLPHPNGLVVHPDIRMGPNCMIFQQVTIGASGGRPGVPTIGGHVDIGAGAKILGPVTIGDHARIGANAVVLCDVPAGAIAVGIPARIINNVAANA